MATSSDREKCLGCGNDLPSPRPPKCPRGNCGVVPPAPAQEQEAKSAPTEKAPPEPERRTEPRRGR